MSEVSSPDTLPGETGATEWATWGRTHAVTPQHVLRPASVAELAQGVAAAAQRGLGVRAVGSGCSFSALPLAPEVMVELTGLTGLTAVDADEHRVTVLAGPTIRALNKELDAHGLAVTYDEVRLRTGHSEVAPTAVSLETKFSRRVSMKIPVTSAAMDTVTESAMAIAMAQAGGLGVIHRNMTPERQSAEVRKVKKFESGMVIDPVTSTLDEAATLTLRQRLAA
jgi:hypothetical protein